MAAPDDEIEHNRWSEGDELLMTGYYAQARRAFEDERASASGSWSAAEQMTYHCRMANVAHKLGRYSEMLDHCDAGIVFSRPAVHSITAELRAWAAMAQTMLGRPERAQSEIDHGLALLATVDPATVTFRARALVYRAIASLRASEGRLREAVEASEVALRAAEEGEDPWECSTARYHVGDAYSLVGQHATAMRHLDAAFREKQEIGDRWGLAYIHRSRLRIFLDHGQHAEALREVEEGVEIARELDDAKLLAMLEVDYGRLAYRQGDYETAAALAEASLHRARECGAGPEEINSRVLSGFIALASGDHGEALKLADVALRAAEETQQYGELAASQRVAAIALAQAGNFDQARAALEFTVPLVKALGNPYRRLEVDVARIELELAAGTSPDILSPRLQKAADRALAIQAGWQTVLIGRVREKMTAHAKV